MLLNFGMFGVKNARTCPPKTGPEAAYASVFFVFQNVRHRMAQSEIGKSQSLVILGQLTMRSTRKTTRVNLTPFTSFW